MTLRTVEGDELKQLVGLGSLKDVPDYARAIVAEEDGKIVGYWVFQLALLAEPVWIDPTHRSGTIGKRMHDALELTLKEDGAVAYYVHAADPKVGEYLERLGMKPTGWMAYLGELK